MPGDEHAAGKVIAQTAQVLGGDMAIFAKYPRVPVKLRDRVGETRTAGFWYVDKYKRALADIIRPNTISGEARYLQSASDLRVTSKTRATLTSILSVHCRQM